MQIQIYDVIMLAVLLAAAAWGAFKGLAWQAASLASLVLSYFVARQFAGQVAQQINAEPPWNIGAAMLGLYLGTSAAVWLAFRLISGAIDKAKLKSFDRQIGALVGLVKGALLCVVITIFAVSLLGPANRDQVVHSRSGHYIALALDRAPAVLPKEVERVIEPYLHKVEDQLNPGMFSGLRGNGDLGINVDLPDSLPAPGFFKDDVQYFPPAPEFKQLREAAEQGSLPGFSR